MQRLIQRVQDELAAFVGQRDDLVLLAGVNDNDSAVLLKILRDMDQASAEDVFLLFADPFTDLDSYASTTVERLRAEHCLADESARKEGKAALPPMPEDLFDESRPAVARLLEAQSFAQQLLPPGDHRVVWAMVPMSVHDQIGWSELAASLTPARRRIEPWMRQLRVILRDPVEAPIGRRVPLSRRLPIDLGPEAMESSMEEEAIDESLPLARRIQALLSLAFLDYAYKRYPPAMEKFGVLLGYYQSVDNKAMQGLVLNGFGDIYQREDDLVRAREWYEKAAVPAAEGGSPVIFFTVVHNLANVAFKQERFADAEQLYDSAEQIATQNLDPEGKARMLVWRGLSQEAQGKVAEARGSWEEAATLCRSVKLDAQLDESLGHLERLYNRANMRREERDVRAEREQLRRDGLVA